MRYFLPFTTTDSIYVNGSPCQWVGRHFTFLRCTPKSRGTKILQLWFYPIYRDFSKILSKNGQEEIDEDFLRFFSICLMISMGSRVCKIFKVHPTIWNPFYINPVKSFRHLLVILEDHPRKFCSLTEGFSAFRQIWVEFFYEFKFFILNLNSEPRFMPLQLNRRLYSNCKGDLFWKIRHRKYIRKVAKKFYLITAPSPLDFEESIFFFLFVRLHLWQDTFKITSLH